MPINKSLKPSYFSAELFVNFSFLALKFVNFETLSTLYFYMDEFKSGKADITTVTTQMNYNTVKY